MDEQFHVSPRLSKEHIRALLERTDGPALMQFGLQYALFVGAATVLVIAPGAGFPAWVTGAALGVVGLATMAMFAALHESAHNTAFRSVRLNRMAAWLAAAPFFYAPTGFREFHFAHHRFTHDPARDPEIAVAAKPAPAVTSNIVIYLAFFTGLPLLGYKIVLLAAAAAGRPKFLWETLLFYVPERARRRLSWEARAVLALHAAWVTAGVLWAPGLLVVLAGVALGHFMLATYIMAEHNGLPHAGDVLARTRTTNTNGFVKWLMWNMPYHAEHHAYPAVPWHALPELHRIMAPELRHVGTGYGSFHMKALASLIRGKPFEDGSRHTTRSC